MRPAPPYIIDVRFIFLRRVAAEGLFTMSSYSRPLHTLETLRRPYVPNLFTPRPTKFAVQSMSLRSVSSLPPCSTLSNTDIVDSRRKTSTDRVNEWRIYPLEWSHIQLRDHSTSPRFSRPRLPIHSLWRIPSFC